jgi:hypothetical protein
MAELLPSDIYSAVNKDGRKDCFYCNAPAESNGNVVSFGVCKRHREIQEEDFRVGLHKSNRLRDLITKWRETQNE